jgi:pimeloyl-ACP methyl ester carboxylesterase
MPQSPRLTHIALVVFTLFTSHAYSAGLAIYPTPTASFDAGILHVDQFGSGPHSLILIPGLSCGPWVWSDTITKFAPDYTIYALTLPGFDTRPPASEKSLFAAFSRDFWLMLSTHKIASPVAIGHSLGGTLAIALAEQHPDRLSGIIAVDGLPIFPTLAYATPEQRSAIAAQIADPLAHYSKAEQFAGEVQYMMMIGTRQSQFVAPTARLEARSDPKAVAQWMREDLTTDLRPDLAKITIPVLEIMPYNSADPNQPYTQPQTVAFYQSLLAGAPKMSVIPISPSRHFVMLDQPAAFGKTLQQFLSSSR